MLGRKESSYNQSMKAQYNTDVSQSLTPSKCWCGGEAKVKGRMLECSNRNCGSVVMRKTRSDAIAKWNKIMNEIGALPPASLKGNSGLTRRFKIATIFSLSKGNPV